jgi:DNA-directed RNA polymerase sigma subunit (sigma70/sigma32)
MKSPDPILLGCEVLQSIAPGRPKSLDAIAAASGRSKATIRQIEVSALRKLRRLPSLQNLHRELSTP